MSSSEIRTQVTYKNVSRPNRFRTTGLCWQAISLINLVAMVDLAKRNQIENLLEKPPKPNHKLDLGMIDHKVMEP